MAQTNVKVSIIVPIHNTLKYFSKCLDSLTLQTLNETEIIVVDDASTENVKEFLDNYPRKGNISYIRNEKSLGPGGARNIGLKYATGKYVGFCDSDDWVDITYYETAYNAMESTHSDIGMTGLLRKYDTPLEQDIYKCRYSQLICLDSDAAFQILTYQRDMGIKVIPPCTNKIYRKSFLTENQLTFEPNVYFQDDLFSVKCITKTEHIVCIPNVLYYHYKRPDSIIQSFSEKHIEDYYFVFSEIKSYLIAVKKYDRYEFGYFRFAEHFYNLIVRQIFEFSKDEDSRKKYLISSFKSVKKLIDFKKYFKYLSSEEIRNHIQPYIKDTSIN